MYNPNEIIEMNKFSNLHDGQKIFFCKTDYIENFLIKLSKLNTEVILISGNSDYGVTDGLLHQKPKNVKYWFAANKTTQSNQVDVIPIGIENTTPCSIGVNHGYVWSHAKEKHVILSQIKNKKPSKLIYSNFTIDEVRHSSRKKWKKISQDSEHITWNDSNLNYNDMCNQILDHEAVLCPLGNKNVPEGDNHRVYEVLYCGRIPIVHCEDYYKKLYHLFPVILIKENQLDIIADEDYIKHEIQKVKNKKFDPKYMNFSYWKELILKAKENLK